MEEKLVNILNQMAEYLNISQMKKLQEVLLKNLAQPETTKVETTNDTYLQMFLDAKKIEGCSERTLQYYRVTVEKMFQMLKTPNVIDCGFPTVIDLLIFRKICPDLFRCNLSDRRL